MLCLKCRLIIPLAAIALYAPSGFIKIRKKKIDDFAGVFLTCRTKTQGWTNLFLGVRLFRSGTQKWVVKSKFKSDRDKA